MKHVDSLQKRFDIVIASTTEKDFYLNCYYYFDYIYSNEDLLELYHNAYRDYSSKFADIWGDWIDEREAYLDSDRTIEPPEITTQPNDVYRMEKFDMYCNACALDVRVYHPIKHYKECEHELCNDYNGSLLINGLKETLRRYKDDYRNSKKDITKTFKNWYEGEREHYESELSRFHMEFIEAVKKLEVSEVPKNSEFKPFLNEKTGEFFYYGNRGTFPLAGQEFRVLKKLQDNKGEPVTYLELIQAIMPSVTEVREAHKMTLRDVLKNIKTRLGVLPKSKSNKKDPIKVVRRYGYKLVL